MKKIYEKPEIELLSFVLSYDVLGYSVEGDKTDIEQNLDELDDNLGGDPLVPTPTP